ncbi:MAG: hypothetical protein FWD38_01090 [Oscillospiraceae bacterium]|nr:hypothetical protein [Oscillospiraceae bacterium]
MDLFIIFLVLSVISSALAQLLKYRFEQTIAITCFSIIVILYVFGLFRIMLFGYYFILAVSVVALGVCVWNIYIKKFILNNIFTPGFVVFCLLYVFFCYVHRDRILIYWDEFSHWGLVVKNMYMLDAFGNHPYATTAFRGYPPGSALFHYFWMKVSGYNESNFYISMGVLGSSLLLPIFKNITWNNFKVIPLAALFVFILPVFPFNYFYTEVYVDALLGILTAYILFSYFTEKNYDFSFYINIILAFAVLTIVKASGFGLALIAALIIIIDLINKAYKSRNDKKYISENGIRIKTILLRFWKSRTFLISAIVLITPILVNFSWSIYRNFTNTAYAWSAVSDMTLSAVIEFIKGNGEPYQYIVLNRFIGSLMFGVSSLYFTYFQNALILAAILLIWIMKSNNSEKNNLISASVGIFCGWILYAISLVVIYLFAWSDFEAVVLASFSRYMNTYFTIIICMFCCLFIFYTNEKSISKNKKFAYLAILLSVFLFLFDLGVVLRLLDPPTDGGRGNVTISKISSMEFDYKDDRINYIAQNSEGLHYWMARYEMTPIEISEYMLWSIGTPYYDGDIYTRNITLNEWLDILRRDYTYVYLEYIDEQFVTQFGGAFENVGQIQNNSLYKVTEQNGQIILVYVDI